MKKILIWKGKHADLYYDVSTDLALAEASLDVLRAWIDDYQYIYVSDNPLDPEYLAKSWNTDWRETVEWSKKELVDESEPTQLYNRTVRKAKEKVAQRVADYERSKQDYDAVRKLVDEWDTSDWVRPSSQNPQTGFVYKELRMPKAWRMLQDLAGGEYQQIDIQSLEIPLRPEGDD